MKKRTNSKFHFTTDFGMFYGIINNNMMHKHFASQISISESNSLELVTDSDSDSANTSTCYIKPNLLHKLESKDDHLTILINPICRIGHYLNLVHSIENSNKLSKNISHKLQNCLSEYRKSKTTFSEFCDNIHSVLNQFVCDCEKEIHVEDDRILKVINYLDENFARTISLKEVADYCFLSESRLLHLFKEKTGLNFRRYQLWNRLIKSLPSLTNNSITKTAHQFGFSDSSHYARTFKETFGVTPKFLLN